MKTDELIILVSQAFLSGSSITAAFHVVAEKGDFKQFILLLMLGAINLGIVVGKIVWKRSK
jgi:hypothetical protein